MIAYTARITLFMILVMNISACAFGRDHDDEQQHIDALMSFYQQWRGSPYRLGGETRKGIDCSALVQQGFRSVYRMSLPRTTREQAKLGSRVVFSRAPGDLVFFKTGRNTYHVGIYLENDRFIHASTSKGVMISSLNNSYWKARYWKTKRL